MADSALCGEDPSSSLATLGAVLLPVETQAAIPGDIPGDLQPSDTPPAVIITPTLCEVSVLPGGPFTDSYTVRLSSAPTALVLMTITALFSGGSPYAQLSIDGGLSYHDSLVLTFAAGDTTAKTIMVRLVPGTVLLPGSMVETISSSLRSADPTFNLVPVPNVYVNGFLAECGALSTLSGGTGTARLRCRRPGRSCRRWCRCWPCWRSSPDSSRCWPRRAGGATPTNGWPPAKSGHGWEAPCRMLDDGSSLHLPRRSRMGLLRKAPLTRVFDGVWCNWQHG